MICELLFLTLALATLAAIITGLVSWGSGRSAEAVRLALVLGMTWAAYLAVVVLVADLVPPRIVPPGQDLCFDEMCFSVVGARQAARLGPIDHGTVANGIFLVVSVRVSSHSRGRPQSEGGLRARLTVDSRSWPVSKAGMAALEAEGTPSVPLTTRLQPGQSIVSLQVFDVPRGISDWRLDLDHGLTPGYLVIGESPLFHPPALMVIPRGGMPP